MSATPVLTSSISPQRRFSAEKCEIDFHTFRVEILAITPQLRLDLPILTPETHLCGVRVANGTTVCNSPFTGRRSSRQSRAGFPATADHRAPLQQTR
jgi:hypothetical protein